MQSSALGGAPSTFDATSTACCVLVRGRSVNSCSCDVSSRTNRCWPVASSYATILPDTSTSGCDTSGCTLIRIPTNPAISSDSSFVRSSLGETLVGGRYRPYIAFAAFESSIFCARNSHSSCRHVGPVHGGAFGSTFDTCRLTDERTTPLTESART